MQILHRGLVIELGAEDPRVGRVETLLFGGPLPPPVVEPPPPVAPPEPVVPLAMQLFWQRLSAPDRRELSLLAARAYPVAELEAALGMTHQQLRARHSVIAKTAKRVGVPHPIGQRRRGRARRQFFVPDATAELIRHLAAMPPTAGP